MAIPGDEEAALDPAADMAIDVLVGTTAKQLDGIETEETRPPAREKAIGHSPIFSPVGVVIESLTATASNVVPYTQAAETAVASHVVVVRMIASRPSATITASAS